MLDPISISKKNSLTQTSMEFEMNLHMRIAVSKIRVNSFAVSIAWQMCATRAAIDLQQKKKAIPLIKQTISLLAAFDLIDLILIIILGKQ